jgi:hypothetical protein
LLSGYGANCNSFSFPLITFPTVFPTLTLEFEVGLKPVNHFFPSPFLSRYFTTFVISSGHFFLADAPDYVPQTGCSLRFFILPSANFSLAILVGSPSYLPSRGKSMLATTPPYHLNSAQWGVWGPRYLKFMCITQSDKKSPQDPPVVQKQCFLRIINPLKISEKFGKYAS